MNALVGFTGFVGSNLYDAAHFDAVYNSRNIESAYGTSPDLLIYAGVRAEKYLANDKPEKDMECIVQASENIRKINPKKLVLISTIDVFKVPKNVDEKTDIDVEELHPYGYNRYRLECMVRENYPDALIVRLPALFGKNMKKNFIYDYKNRIPNMLREDKLYELSMVYPEFPDFYKRQGNGFYKVKELSDREKQFLSGRFDKAGFTSLNFTDSRSRYQFYPLSRLWDDIQTALREHILLLHTATEPVSAEELFFYLSGEKFENRLEQSPADYNYKTIYASLFGGHDGYICTKDTIMRKIKEVVMSW